MILNKKNKTRSWLFALAMPAGVFFFMSFANAEISEIENITVISNTRNITVEWSKPILQETEGIIVIRKKEACPKSAADGETVYRGNGNNFLDDTAEKNSTYCYGAYVYDSSGAVSALKTSGLVKIKSWSEYARIILEDNMFIGVGIFLIIILGYLNVIKRKKYIL
jgi:hypothetical protein